MAERIAITGVGVVSAIGAGVEEFDQSLYEGVTGVAPSGRAEIIDFAPQRWLGAKGIRTLDRTARLLCVATQLALEDSRLDPEGAPDPDAAVGMVCGTMFGGVNSIVSFDWSGLVEGPTYVNPMEFPNTVINSPAGQAAIRFKLRGINSTICVGLSSALYAAQYAVEMLQAGRASALLVAGADELCDGSILGFRKNGVTLSSGLPHPFQRDSSGAALGEGAVVLVLEPVGAARARGATVWAEIAGFGCAQDAQPIEGYYLRGRGAAHAIQEALASAGVKPADVGCVISSANGHRPADVTEARALARVFGGHLRDIPVCAPKAACGEAMGASGALGLLTGALALRRRLAPPTVGATAVHKVRLSRTAQPFDSPAVLVNAVSYDGNNASMVLTRPMEA